MGEVRDRYRAEGGKAYKSDDSIFDVTAWREAMQTAIEGTLKIRTSVHELIHEGKSFLAYHNNLSLASGSTINIYLETSASPGSAPHMIADTSGSGAYDFEILEAPTVTALSGTAQDVYNKNRQSATTSTVSDNDGTSNSVSTDVTTTADGTVIFFDTLSLGNKQGGQKDYDRELILAPSTEYVFRLTSRENGNRVHINLSWYEPA